MKKSALSARTVTLLRTEHLISVHPTPPDVLGPLQEALTFTVKYFLRGREAYLAVKAGRSTVVYEDHFAYDEDVKGRITTVNGFAARVKRVLRQHGYQVVEKNLTPHKNPAIFEPRWERVFDGDTRLLHRQDEFLAKIATYENGVFVCPTGYGKSFLIGQIAKMWPKARIAVVSDSVTVVRDRIYPELAGMLPDVGIVGGGRKKRGSRVTCYTVDSLHWLLADCKEFGEYDAVIFDEVHLAAADNCAKMLGMIPGQPRMYGFTATHNMRGDQKDFRVEAQFGPIRMEVGFQEAAAHGMIVPVRVLVRKVVMDVNPCEDYKGQDKTRYGIWQNGYRNRLVLRDAIKYAAQGKQTMITTYALEHLLYVKEEFDKMKADGEVPEGLELECVYREFTSEGERQNKVKDLNRKFKGIGHVLKAMPLMTLKRRMRLTKQVEKGRIKLFVATTIFNVGFDPKNMWVVCRADCGSTDIASTQIPGRNVRHTKGRTKRVAILRDYDDKFDDGLHRRFLNRKGTYRMHQWPVKYVGKKSALRRHLEWDD